jgi:glucokinase
LFLRSDHGNDTLMEQPRRSRDALVADIGGTNARFAVVDINTLELSNIKHFLCSEHPSLVDIAKAYLGGLGTAPRHGAIAVAAPIRGELISLTNSSWRCSRAYLRDAIAFEDLLVLNDLQALALSLPHLQGSTLRQIGGLVIISREPKVVVGAGTGLGVAGLVWGGDAWIAISTEGGHVSLAAHTPLEQEIACKLAVGRDRLSAERVLSGPGLADLYVSIAEIENVRADTLIPNEVINRGLDKSDPIAMKALEVFAGWLGAFAGDAALLCGARGGVYLGGGIAPRIADLISTGSFRGAFEAKGRMQAYLAEIPIYVILAEFAALKGAGIALRQSMAASAS